MSRVHSRCMQSTAEFGYVSLPPNTYTLRATSIINRVFPTECSAVDTRELLRICRHHRAERESSHGATDSWAACVMSSWWKITSKHRSSPAETLAKNDYLASSIPGSGASFILV